MPSDGSLEAGGCEWEFKNMGMTQTMHMKRGFAVSTVVLRLPSASSHSSFAHTVPTCHRKLAHAPLLLVICTDIQLNRTVGLSSRYQR